MKSLSNQGINPEDLQKIVVERLTGHSKCYGHCEEQTELKFLAEKQMLVGCYVCSSGYVSRIVTYGREIEIEQFKDLLSEAVHGMEDVSKEDIRVASRYTWDLEVEGETDGLVLKEAYWTQNYGKRKRSDPSRLALFLCAKCGSFYQQPLTGTNGMCTRCRSQI